MDNPAGRKKERDVFVGQTWQPHPDVAHVTFMRCYLFPPPDSFLFFCLLLLSAWSGLRGRTDA